MSEPGTSSIRAGAALDGVTRDGRLTGASDTRMAARPGTHTALVAAIWIVTPVSEWQSPAPRRSVREVSCGHAA